MWHDPQLRARGRCKPSTPPMTGREGQQIEYKQPLYLDAFGTSPQYGNCSRAGFLGEMSHAQGESYTPRHSVGLP